MRPHVRVVLLVIVISLDDQSVESPIGPKPTSEFVFGKLLAPHREMGHDLITKDDVRISKEVDLVADIPVVRLRIARRVNFSQSNCDGAIFLGRGIPGADVVAPTEVAQLDRVDGSDFDVGNGH